MYSQTKEKHTYFLYARKSSESEDRQVQSIDDQISCLKELASKLQIEIKEIIAESKTSKKPYCRPLFTDMLKRIEKGEADGILCWHLNRLSRNPVDSGTLGWMLQQRVLKSIQTMEREFLPDDNVLLFNVESGMANQYIIDLKKVSYRGMAKKAERGWLPAIAPVGYKNDKANHTIIPDPERFELVRRMWEMLLTGNYTVGEIKIIATEQWGFKTLLYKKSGGLFMLNGFIYRMFSNIFYTGMFDWGGKRYNGNHTPMITLAEYERAQEILGRTGKPRHQVHTCPYTGLIRCAICGSMFTVTEKKKYVKRINGYNSYTYYHCTKKKKEIVCYGQKPIKEDKLETQIKLELMKYAIHPVFRDWAIEHLQKEREKESTEKIVKNSTQEILIKETEKELTSLTRMRIKEMVDDATFTDEKERLQKILMKLKRQEIENENNSIKWIDLTEKTFDFAFFAYKNFKTATVAGDIPAKREIVSSLGSNFSIKDEKLLFEASKWLVPIEKGYPALFEEYNRLELQKMVDIERRNAILNSISMMWRGIVQDVRTIFETLNNTSIYIPSSKPEENPPVPHS